MLILQLNHSQKENIINTNSEINFIILIFVCILFCLCC